MTANWASISMIVNQIPMLSARSATARLKQSWQRKVMDPPCLPDKLLGVEPDLDPVVEEGEERGEGEDGHEDGDEAKLEHHLQVLLEQA